MTVGGGSNHHTYICNSKGRIYVTAKANMKDGTISCIAYHPTCDNIAECTALSDSQALAENCHTKDVRTIAGGNSHCRDMQKRKRNNG